MRIDPNITITHDFSPSDYIYEGQRAAQDAHKLYAINADIPGHYELITVLIAKLTLSLL